MTRRPRTLRRRLRSHLFRVAHAALVLSLRPLSWRAAQRLGAAAGRLAFRLARRDRRRALAHLELAFPDTSDSGRARIARAAFEHLGTSLAECLHLASRDCRVVSRHVVVEGREHVAQAQRTGRPILVLTGHCGNWELLAATISCGGLPLSVVARELDDPVLDRAIVRLRARFGTRTIARAGRGAARKLLATLRGGGALGMLIDQDTRVDGVWVPFFGRPAFTPVGAAEIALRRDAVVLPAFIERREDGSHRARFHAPLDLTGDVTAATARMSEEIERQIRRVPAQWVWMHRRWRRRPSRGRPDAREGESAPASG